MVAVPGPPYALVVHLHDALAADDEVRLEATHPVLADVTVHRGGIPVYLKRQGDAGVRMRFSEDGRKRVGKDA